MKVIAKLIFSIFSLAFIFYLLLPNSGFPKPLSDAIQSNEPGDTESPLIRAYFTNFTREEVMSHYQSQLKYSSFLNFVLPTYRLNYPPEEAHTIIRDQTRSTFLEEIVHPFRESVFINGFKPDNPKDAIIINDKYWHQKINVRYIPSSPLIRVGVAIPTLLLLAIVIRSWKDSLKDLVSKGRK